MQKEEVRGAGDNVMRIDTSILNRSDPIPIKRVSNDEK
jgi:hypothetical protein